MFTILVLLFTFILFKGFSVSQSFDEQSNAFSKVAKGETQKIYVEKRWVWASRLNQQQQQTLQQRNSNQQLNCCEPNLCVVATATERAGIDLVFTQKRPPQLSDVESWVGGFVNPNSGVVYDLSGLAYQTGKANLKQVCP